MTSVQLGIYLNVLTLSQQVLKGLQLGSEANALQLVHVVCGITAFPANLQAGLFALPLPVKLWTDTSFVGPSQLAAISACSALRAFLAGNPRRWVLLLWVPAHKNIEPNEFVDELAKAALDGIQPDFVSYSMALARVRARMKSKWDRVALDANNTAYRGRHLWVANDPPLHGATANSTWLLRHAGMSNHDTARAARFLTNHFPSRQLRDQCGWSADDVLEFLRLNPMVSTFGWSEILAEALADCERGQPHSRANARLLAHTVERVFRWQQFHRTRRKAPAFTSSLSADFADFTEWCDVETRAENLLILWEERALALAAHY
ncbi:predicted protein [Postia placenta Mad-698-R]|nr:predicted protein [Postia placenta Mad-698-R]